MGILTTNSGKNAVGKFLLNSFPAIGLVLDVAYPATLVALACTRTGRRPAGCGNECAPSPPGFESWDSPRCAHGCFFYKQNQQGLALVGLIIFFKLFRFQRMF